MAYTYTHGHITRHTHSQVNLTRIQVTRYRAIRDTSVEDREQEDNTSAREHS